MVFVFILKKLIIIEEINGNNGEKHLPRYVGDFKCGL